MSGDAIEKVNATAVFTFGRFQPPTIGHKVLIDSLASAAEENGADAYVFVSSRCNDLPKYTKSKKYKNMMESNTFETCDANENPLSVYQKVHWLQKMHADSGVKIINTTEHDCRTIFQVADKLRAVGYTSLILLVGSDRVPTFSKMFDKSNNVSVLPAGAKRNTSNAPSGMSGTKMRHAAVRGEFEAFKRGVMIGSMTVADAKELMNQVRAGLGYKAVGGGKGTRKMHKTRGQTRKHKIRICEKSKGSWRPGPDGC